MDRPSGGPRRSGPGRRTWGGRRRQPRLGHPGAALSFSGSRSRRRSSPSGDGDRGGSSWRRARRACSGGGQRRSHGDRRRHIARPPPKLPQESGHAGPGRWRGRPTGSGIGAGACRPPRRGTPGVAPSRSRGSAGRLRERRCRPCIERSSDRPARWKCPGARRTRWEETAPRLRPSSWGRHGTCQARDRGRGGASSDSWRRRRFRRWRATQPKLRSRPRRSRRGRSTLIPLPSRPILAPGAGGEILRLSAH